MTEFASNVTPNSSQTRKCRTVNTQDSRDSVEKEDASKQEQESKVKRRTMSRRDSTHRTQEREKSDRRLGTFFISRPSQQDLREGVSFYQSLCKQICCAGVKYRDSITSLVL